MKRIDWTDQKIKELKAHWTSNLSMSEIGAAMGTTRNAVIGKCHRLGFPERPQHVDAVERDERAQKRSERQALEQRNRRQKRSAERKEMRMQEGIVKRASPKSAPAPAPVQPPAFVGSLNIPFADLRRFSNSEPNECRNIPAEPPGPDYLACGTETLPGESWCSHCKGIVFARPANFSAEDLERRSRSTTRKFRATAVKYAGTAREDAA